MSLKSYFSRKTYSSGRSVAFFIRTLYWIIRKLFRTRVWHMKRWKAVFEFDFLHPCDIKASNLSKSIGSRPGRRWAGAKAEPESKMQSEISSFTWYSILYVRKSRLAFSERRGISQRNLGFAITTGPAIGGGKQCPFRASSRYIAHARTLEGSQEST